MSNFNLPDTITFWIPASNDGMGGKTWTAPVAIPARIALVTEEVFNPAGKSIITTHAIYTRTLLAPETYIALSEETALSPTSDAKKVVKATYTGSMSDMARMLI